MKLGYTLALSALLASSALAAHADFTLLWSRSGDSLTLDPMSYNEGPTNTISHQIYEPLVLRNETGAMEAALATEWGPSAEDPTVWVFKLREGVKFHDGADFDADDVVFSIERAKSENSAFKELLTSVVEVRAVDPYTIEIVTDGPNPILPANLTDIFMIDKDWAEANGVVDVQNFDSGVTNFATNNTNGTGPYKLVSREQDVKTVMTSHEDYWGNDMFPLDVTEIVYVPIQNAATRVAALLSDEVNFTQDVPVQDLQRVAGTPGLVVRTAPQNRVIFFGLNTGDADLVHDNVDGANPLADVRVRQAMNMAINRDAIRQVVMRGQSQPAGVIMPSFVNGWTQELDTVPPTDVAKAKELMSEAGYADGFTIQLDCPNDRYINDEPICQSVVAMLGQIGITVNLDAKPKAQHFPLITQGVSDFYMLGWAVPTMDSEYIFNFLFHTPGDERGSWNNTKYSNTEVDEMIVSLASNTDLDARNETIAKIWDVVQSETLYLPIHHQVLNWGMKDNIEIGVDPEGEPKIKYMKVQ